ncbi:MAG: hypothetical protein QNJ38_19800 [Prochloraceae cyanobacterium]|nr:hypothetical protein [Prochloraceae cyanobacterium]
MNILKLERSVNPSVVLAIPSAARWYLCAPARQPSRYARPLRG